MTYQYGFELEGFMWEYGENNRLITPSRVGYVPVDGFPGLVELRTRGGQHLVRAYMDILGEFLLLRYDSAKYFVDFASAEERFSGEELAWMRKHCTFGKVPLDIKNVYGKSPRNLGGRTIASLQINISNYLHSDYDKTGREIKKYGLLDIHGIVKRLDKEFEEEIRTSRRQPGMYAIKEGIRLEYRSLPNFVFPWADFNQQNGFVNVFLERIRKAVEG